MKRDAKPRKPEAWRVTREFLRFIEEHAIVLRQRTGIGPLDRLDPYSLAERLDVKILPLDQLSGLTSEDRLRLANMSPKIWSGGGLPLPDGKTLVLLHPQQTRERANVTLLEEVCHVYFGHNPSRLLTLPTGIVKREYDEQAEHEAYWTAGAALLPSEAIAKGVWRGLSAEALAQEYGASVELAEMRIRTLGLWNDYLGRKRKAS